MNLDSYLAGLRVELVNARRTRPDVVGEIEDEIDRVEREIAREERENSRVVSMVGRHRKQVVAEEPPEPQVYGAY